MADGIIFKVSATIDPPAGVEPVPRRKDILLTEWDRQAWDVMHPTSWPSQANPTSGQKLQDLSGLILDTPDDAKGSGFSGTLPTFDNAMKIASGSNTRITIPALCKPATDSNGYIAILWALVPETATIGKLFGWFTTGSNAYGAYFSGTNRQFAVMGDGGSSTLNVPDAQFDISIGGVDHALMMFAVGRCEDGSGGYLRKRKAYTKAAGSVLNASSAGGGTAAQSSAGSTFIGQDGVIAATNLPFRVFRHRFLDVLTEAGAMTAAAFDAICDAEFAGNKDRTDWNIS